MFWVFWLYVVLSGYVKSNSSPLGMGRFYVILPQICPIGGLHPGL